MIRLKNFHMGDRAFLVACGPSLKDTDVELLNKELVIGVSLSYKKKGLDLWYHCVGDKLIAKQFSSGISKVDTVATIVSKGIYDLNIIKQDKLIYFTGHGKKKFHTDLTKRIYGGGTSTFIGMQLAYWMGIKNLCVVGLDHSWKFESVEITDTKKQQGDVLQTKGKDTDHFTDDYYGDGIQWYKPKREKMAESYAMARKAFEKDGRQLWNGSLETELSEDILPRIGLNDWINN